MAKYIRPAAIAGAIILAVTVGAAAYMAKTPPQAPAVIAPSQSARLAAASPVVNAPPDSERPKAVALLATDQDPACTADRVWCVVIREGEDGLARPLVLPAAQARAQASPQAASSGGETHSAWPMLVMLKDGGFLAGVETRLSTNYSGGGGSATELRLFRVSKGGDSEEDPVLILPLQGSLMIRACFSAEDVKARREACHDNYGFEGVVRIDASSRDMPWINYSTQAWAFPRGSSRNEDSTQRGPLEPADLVQQGDETCSFRRRFEFSPITGRYEPDAALPDCSAYTVP